MTTILLVEDDRALATHWREALEAEEYRVVHEVTVEGAIQALDEVAFDVVITDVILETDDAQLTESGGFAVISYIALNVDPAPRILATSGLESHSTFVDRNFAKMSSLRALQKPISDTKLVETVKELLQVQVPDRQAEQSERIQNLIHSNEAMLELLGATDGVWDWKVGTDEVTFAPGFRKLLGFDGDDIEGFPDTLEAFSTHIHPADREAVWARINKSLLDKSRFIREFRLRLKSGDHIWVRSRATASFDEQGIALRMVGSMHDITDSVVARHQLEESEARFRSIADTLPSIVRLMNPDGSIEWVNDFVLNFTGVEETAIYENGWAPLVHPDDLAKAEADAKTSLQSQSGYNNETRLRRVDGEYRWFQCQAVPRFDAVGKFLGLVVSEADIHESREGYLGELERLNAELTASNEQLQRTTEWLEQAMLGGNVGITETDVASGEMNASESFFRMRGYDTPIKWNVDVAYEHIHKDDRRPIEEAMQHAVKQKQNSFTTQFRTRFADGSYRWVSRTSGITYGDNGTPIKLVSAVSDIHDLKTANEQLAHAKYLAEESEARFRMIASSAPAIIYLADTEGRTTWVNQQHTELTGEGEDAVHDFNWAELIHPDDVDGLVATVQRSAQLATDYTAEFRIRNAAGEYLWHRGTGIPRFDEDETHTGFVGIVTDIHLSREEHVQELETVALKLQAANDELELANEELERFAYVASHDLQEPLRAVGGFLQLLEKGYSSELDEKARGYIQKSVDGAARMSRLINDLLAFSRVTREAVDLTQQIAMDEVIALALTDLKQQVQDAGAELIIDDLPMVNGNLSLLVQLFRNLIGNAIKYRREQSPEVKIGYDRAHRRLFVQDNGIGIAPEYQEQIFELFKRLHRREEYPGTGLGLAICQRIAERHGWAIQVESTVGEGSCFFVQLNADQ